MMKTLRFSLIALLLLACQGLRAQVSFGRAELFNDDWLFSLSDETTAQQPAYDDSSWRRLSVPHDWSIEGQLSPQNASCTGYLPAGIGWYRKHFTLGADRLEKAYIYFEGVYNRSEVYLNGHLLGRRPNGYVSFLYDMTPWLRQGDNVLAVRVDHSRMADSRWYTGSGIYRDVWLVQAPQVHLSQWGAAYRLKEFRPDGSATVEVDVSVDAPATTATAYQGRVTILDDDRHVQASATVELGRLPQGQTQRTLELTVPQARRWTLSQPHLYQLHVELLSNGLPTDSARLTMGLRTLQFDADRGFALNGEWMKVKGVCLHHDGGVLGAAVPRELWVRRVRELKRMGANAIRMSHNPQAPVLYDICDREGMLVIDEGSDEWEFPKRKWIKGWNQGEPGYDGTFDFFEEWIERDVADMVLRDRHHPSVFLWSVGNEVDYPNDPYSHPVLDGGNAAISQPMFGGYKADAPRAERIGTIAKRIAAVIRSIDRSRPVTGALAGVVMSNETEYPAAIDVVGYNYTEKRYDEDHTRYPDRIIYGSETGVGYDAWKAVRDRQHIFGQFVWTGTDYLGESGRWPSRGLNTGLLDFGNFRKPRGWFRASLWSDEPVTFIGTYPLPKPRAGRQGRRNVQAFISPEAQDDWNLPERLQADTAAVTMRVVCYTNAPQARLLLNGRQVGALQPKDDSNGIIHWDIAYEPGTLRAEGCDMNGQVLSSYEIVTNGAPVALRTSELLPDDCAELHQLLVEIIDKGGHRVHSATDDVTCTIQGPAVLLGLEGSNNSDMSDYRDEHQPAYRGRLVAYVRRTAPGAVTVTFSAKGLQPCTIQL